MHSWIKKEKNLFFAVGALAGVVAVKVFKAKKTRELAVLCLAKGMALKDVIMEEVTNIREDADDIYSEAKTVAQMRSENTTEK